MSCFSFSSGFWILLIISETSFSFAVKVLIEYEEDEENSSSSLTIVSFTGFNMIKFFKIVWGIMTFLVTFVVPIGSLNSFGVLRFLMRTLRRVLIFIWRFLLLSTIYGLEVLFLEVFYEEFEWDHNQTDRKNHWVLYCWRSVVVWVDFWALCHCRVWGQSD